MRRYYKFKIKAKEFLDKIGLLNFFTTLYGIRWYIRHVKCKVEAKMRARGYLDKRYERLREFEGVHEGERCFIVCTGPSLTLKDIEVLKDEYTFGMNTITKIFSQTDWRPTYYVIDDIGGYVGLENELIESKLEICFTSDLLVDMVKPKVDFIAYPFERVKQYWPSETPRLEFSGNAYEIVYGAYTVTCSAMQLAVYMGFKEIYLIGCDCDYSGEKKHFIDDDIKNEHRAIDTEQKMIMTYETAKKYADTHDIKILNATRGGKLEVFERVDFDSLFVGD